MIHHLDLTIAALIKRELTILGWAETDYGISFDPPDKNLKSDQTSIVNLYAYYVHENRSLLDNQYRITRQNGVAIQEKAPVWLDVHYLVTVWPRVDQSDPKARSADEHRLLSHVSFGLLRHPYVKPKELLSAADLQKPFFADLSDAMLEAKLPAFTAQPENLEHIGEFWSTMEQPWKPTLCYVVSIPIDLKQAQHDPIVTSGSTSYRRDEGSGEDWMEIGGIVRDTAGKTIAEVAVYANPDGPNTKTDKAGQFILTLKRGATYTLIAYAAGRGRAERDVEVPSLTGEYDLQIP